MASKKTILITGDVVTDYHIYRRPPESRNPRNKPATIMHQAPGGVALVFDLLEEFARQAANVGSAKKKKAQSAFNAVCGLKNIKRKAPASVLSAYGVWQPHESVRGAKEKVWRLSEALGYGDRDKAGLPPVDDAVLMRPANVVVLDDGQLAFRSRTAASAWPAFLRPSDEKPKRSKKWPQPDWIVLKMSAPIGVGDLWRAVCAKDVSSKTVVLASMDDLRLAEVRVTSAISWERTAQDLVRELLRNPALSPLLECDYCIISISSEGAVLIDGSNPKKRKFKLIFDPQTMEGDWAESEGIDGRVFGFMSCVTAAVAGHLTIDNSAGVLERGIRSGLAAMRALHRLGHGSVEHSNPRLPTAEIAATMLAPEEKFASVEIPIPSSSDADSTDSWTILGGQRDGSRVPLYGIARQVAILGPKVALNGIPFQQMESLFTVDRVEIESLRNLRQLVRDYDAQDSGEKPLSIAVFGAPGSGKSFSVKQLARSVLGKKVPILEFNLSQFTENELAGALHQVRDKVLEGKMPVVFWDEFDSRNYKWLRHLLAPMQDGSFQEGQIVHPIGKCVFVFAGGTSYDFENFGPAKGDETHTEFKLAKGPDFKSRLHGYLNVLGPNRRQRFDAKTGDWIDDESDVCFPVRRALLLRVFLEYFKDEILRIDDGVLAALLELDRYVHGARSMENVVKQVVSRGVPGIVRRSDLAPAEVMSMHADYEEFMTIADRDLKFKAVAALPDRLARAIHNFYLELDPSSKADEKFEDLSEYLKADNVAAALRIPKVLGLGGLYVVEKKANGAGTTKAVKELLKDKIELFAEAEHDGWMEHKLINGWRQAQKRDDKARVHNLLIAYRLLPDREREKDRDSVSKYPEILDSVGYKIAKSLSD